MVKNLEKQLEAPAKKPAGGVSLFFMPNAGPQRAATPGGKPQVGCRMLRVHPAIPYRTSSEFGGPGVKVGEGPASVILCPSGTSQVTSLCPVHMERWPVWNTCVQVNIKKPFGSLYKQCSVSLDSSISCLSRASELTLCLASCSNCSSSPVSSYSGLLPSASATDPKTICVWSGLPEGWY